MHVDGGATDANASNARVLTQLILREPALDPLLPSAAEALAAYASAALAIGSVQTSFKHYLAYGDGEGLNPLPAGGSYETFGASVRTQEYTSSYEEDWQRVFYVVLILIFVINVVCLAYLLLQSGGGLVADYTEPQNLFALALNSPPSAALAGSCGAGPNLAEMVAPWRVAYAEGHNHYFFEEAGHSPVAVKRAGTLGAESVATGLELPTADRDRGLYGESYKRLSMTRPSAWM